MKPAGVLESSKMKAFFIDSSTTVLSRKHGDRARRGYIAKHLPF
jgi:hypothetical protein